MSGERRGQTRTRLPVLSTDVPVVQTLRVMRDNTQAMRRILANIDSKMQGAMDWAQDPVLGGDGEACVRNIIQMLLRVSERSLPRESKRLVALSDEISHIVRNEQGGIGELVEKLIRVIPLILKAIKEVERSISKEERNQLRHTNKRKKDTDPPKFTKKVRRD